MISTVPKKGSEIPHSSVIRTASTEATETLVNPAHDAVTGQEIPGTKRTRWEMKGEAEGEASNL